jgi:hypothetical protein
LSDFDWGGFLCHTSGFAKFRRLVKTPKRKIAEDFHTASLQKPLRRGTNPTPAGTFHSQIPHLQLSAIQAFPRPAQAANPQTLSLSRTQIITIEPLTSKRAANLKHSKPLIFTIKTTERDAETTGLLIASFLSFSSNHPLFI